MKLILSLGVFECLLLFGLGFSAIVLKSDSVSKVLLSLLIVVFGIMACICVKYILREYS